MPNTPTPKQLAAENAKLRTILKDAEEALRAIRSGEVDALVLTGAEGDHIHTMEGAQEPYRVMVEAMNEGAVTLAADSTILYCNSHFADWVKVPLRQIVGTSLKDMLAEQDRVGFAAMLVQGTKEDIRDALTLQAADGKQTPALFSMSPLPQSEGKMISVVIADLSEVVAASEARARLALIVESSDDAIVSITLNGVVESWNKAAKKLYGYTAMEAIGQSIDPIIVPPEYVNEVRDELESIRRGGSILLTDSVRLRKDGSRVNVSIKASPIIDDVGMVVGASINARDISERKAAERVLQNKEKQLTEALEIAKIGYWEYEFATDEFIFNDQYYTLHKITAEEVGGYRMSSTDFASRYVYSEDAPTVAKNIQLAFESSDPEYLAKIETRIISGKGEIVWVDMRFRVEKDLQGNTIKLVGVNQDISERKHAELKLIESERRFTDLLDNVELISMMLDRDARITYCNDYLLHMTGWRRDEVIGCNWWDIFVPSEYQGLRKEYFTALVDGRPEERHHENDIVTRSGERRMIRWNNTVLLSAVGDVIGTASIGEDITEQKKSEASIKSLNRVLSVLSGINTLIVRVNDREELFREACNIVVEKGGFHMAMLLTVDRSTGQTASVVSAGMEDKLMFATKSILSTNEGVQRSFLSQSIREKKVAVSNDVIRDPNVLLRKECEESGVHSLIVLPLIVAGEVVGVITLYANEIGFFQEDEMKLLTELANDIEFAIDHIDKRERLNYLAYYDELTGLANRTLFFERLTQYIRSAATGRHKLAIGLIDLERFKNINDSLGRSTGDSLLKQVTEWLTHRMGDAYLLARIETDHFAILLPEVRSVRILARLIEDLIAAFIQHQFGLNETMFQIGIKVGIALYPDDGDDADILFRNAEAALKKAKASGDRYLFHTRKMTESVAGKLALENQLRQAIDNEEFVLHYQPKVNLVSGKVTGAEALIRWHNPKTGLVPPCEFISILEDTGMIYEVGRWSLDKAMTDYLHWCNAGLASVPISVNVSPLQLSNINFIEEIKQVIALDIDVATGLELEITESVIMNNMEFNVAVLQEIRDMGATIAIDDFGTGFSSLSYLAQLPVDTLKIDRSFIIEMTEGSAGLALVSTIISLAHSLKLKVVAEGVETEEQSRLLRLLSCDEIQGFLFSKPVPADIFEAKFLA